MRSGSKTQHSRLQYLLVGFLTGFSQPRREQSRNPAGNI